MLWNARLRGVSFERLLTIGRQSLYLHPADVASLQRGYAGARRNAECPFLRQYQFGDTADGFFRDMLEAAAVAVLDASDYEGANTVHDMNLPVPTPLRGAFDAVIDGGSLEHIFNVPVALANLAAMVRPGGTLFIFTPANNLMGHGFYQFSPELMFRVFAEENGFALQQVLLREAVYPSVELTTTRHVFEVADPERVGRRVGLLSDRPVMMMVEARKQRDVPLFARTPQQSDYVTRWTTATRPPMSSRLRSVTKRGFRALPLSVQTRILGVLERRAFRLGNRRFYTKVPHVAGGRAI
jgi:SAM-dependent methyltransferase